MSIVKRQHYIWRHYLRAWSDKEKIWSLLKENNKVIYSELINVGQERYFYKLIDLTEDDEILIEMFINDTSAPHVKEMNRDFLIIFTSTSRLKEQLAAATNPVINRAFIEEQIRQLEINAMELAHGKMEGLGMKLVAYRSLKEFLTIEQDDYFFDAIMFLCFQYFRTKNIRKMVLERYRGKSFEERIDRCWNILSYIMATTLAERISLNPEMRMTFIENKTETAFITCDQPVFNILSDQVNEKGDVKELEFYYPISPAHAIYLDFKNAGTRFSGREVEIEEVDFLNQKVLEHADFFVFANNKEQLVAIAEIIY